MKTTGLHISVEQPRALVQPEVHHQRSRVLHQEHSLPTDLWPKILEIQLSTCLQRERLNRLRVGQGLSLGFQSQSLPLDVRRLPQVVQLLLHLPYRGAWIYLQSRCVSSLAASPSRDSGVTNQSLYSN